jgi:hypothetical protein
MHKYAVRTLHTFETGITKIVFQKINPQKRSACDRCVMKITLRIRSDNKLIIRIML